MARVRRGLSWTLLAGFAAGQETCGTCSVPDASALFQRDAQLQQPGAPLATNNLQVGSVPLTDLHVRHVPVTVLAQRKKAIYEIQGEMHRLMQAEAASTSKTEVMGDDKPILDASTIMDQLPALMDSLRDDSFIRDFLEFEDNIEKAGVRFLENATSATAKFLEEFQVYNRSFDSENGTVQLFRDASMTSIRKKVANFMDHFLKVIAPSFTSDMMIESTRFVEHIQQESPLSKSWTDEFIPLISNMSEMVSTKTLPAISGNDNTTLVNMTNLQDLIVDASGVKFCGIMNKMVRNLSKIEKVVSKAIKKLNNTRKLVLPLVGRYMKQTLPDDASQEDKDFPPRFMLVLNYEVDMVFSVLGTYTQALTDFSGALSPLIKTSIGCKDTSGASTRSLGFFTALAALTAMTASLLIPPRT